MVGEKQKASSESRNVKKQQDISFETKVAIIKKLDAGEKMVNVAQMHYMNHLMIGTVYKQKDYIMEHVKSVVVVQFTIISKRGNFIKKIEKLLGIWLKNTYFCSFAGSEHLILSQ